MKLNNFNMYVPIPVDEPILNILKSIIIIIGGISDSTVNNIYRNEEIKGKIEIKI